MLLARLRRSRRGASVDRSPSQRVAAGQKGLCALAADDQADVPGADLHRFDVAGADVGADSFRRRRRDQVVVLGGQEQERAGDPREVDAAAAQRELALHQQVALVEVLDELAERLARDGDVVVDPASRARSGSVTLRGSSICS